MSIQHTQNLGIRTDGGNALSGSITEIGATELKINNQFATGTNVSHAIAFTAANLQSFEMLSNQDMTIKTNSSGAPDNTFNLKAGMPFMWSKSAGYFSNPFTANVTVFYVTNAVPTLLQAKFLTS